MSRHVVARRPAARRLSYTVCGLILWAIAIASLVCGRGGPARPPKRLLLATASQAAPCASARAGVSQPGVEHGGVSPH
jgi:hypothetical protein